MKRYYVSPLGNDDWTGSYEEPTASDGPLRTLARAKAIVREAIADGVSEDVAVILREGAYYLDDALTFTQADSGRDGHVVRYCNYPGETPMIYAGLPVTGWEAHNENIYKTSVDRVFHALYENGQRSVKARYPVSGYNIAESIDDVASLTRFGYQAGDIPTINNINDLQVFIWPAGPQSHWNWFTEIHNIERVDVDKRIATLPRDTRYEIGAGGSRYYVQGALELLTTPGQFYLDEQDMILYYWPRQTPVDEQIIIAPTCISAFAFVGKSRDAVAANIVLEGLNISSSDALPEFGGRQADGNFTLPNENGIIYLENAENITVHGCHIHDTGLHGVFGTGWVQGCEFSSNHLHDIGFTGVLFNGPWATIDYINKHNLVLNNHIHHTGQVVGYGAGVQLANSGDNRVAHNRIHHTPRYSISIKGTWPGHLIAMREVDAVSVREHNVTSFIHTRHNVIEFNDLSDANTDSQDTGVIEGWGVYSAGNNISNNMIHDSDIPFSFGFGIYLDDEVSNTLVSNNVLYNLQQRNDQGMLWGAFYVKGVNNRLRNNIVAHARRCNSVLSMHGFLNAPNHDLEFVRNIAYNVADVVYGFRSWNRDKFRLAEDNLFYNDTGEYRISGAPDIMTLADWQAHLDREYDQFSHTADPQFMDAENHDYRLCFDSPAYALGFQDIDLAYIGLNADFPYADQTDHLARVFVSTANSGQRSFITLASGESIDLNVSGRTVSGYISDLANTKMTFVSSDSSVASVDGHGLVTAVESGVARITVTVEQASISQQGIFDVLVDDAFDRVEIIAPRQRLVNNESMPLRVVGRTRHGQYIYEEDAVVTFTSSPPGAVLVDYDGIVTAQRMNGSAEVTVTMIVNRIRKSSTFTIQLGN